MMNSSRSSFFFISLSMTILLLRHVAPSAAQFTGGCTYTGTYCSKCYETSTYTPGDTYGENLNNLLLSSSSAITSGFYNASLGKDPNKVNVIALCRGDLTLESCRDCLNMSRVILMQNCTKQKEAIIWAEACMLRYSDDSIFGIVQVDPSQHLPSPNLPKNAQQFDLVLNPLLSILNEKAASSGDSAKKFSAGRAPVQPDPSQTIYASAQCTPDIDQQNCSTCLQKAVSEMQGCCGGQSGGRVLKPSCMLRFEVDPFIEDPNFSSLVDISTSDAPPPAPEDGNKSGNTKKTIIIVLVVTAAFVICLGSICIFLRVKKRWAKLEVKEEESDETSMVESLKYEFDTIRSATDDFSDANKLGQGGFGAVYKGKLPNGQDIAVKRLSKDSGQGDHQFTNEVVLLAQLQHRNLVRLLGFCLKSEERLLIYEYVANTSLDHFIFDANSLVRLDWETRYKIIKGVARGILYLHDDSRVRIIHRDLKASNILLDDNMNPKIADFGMARLFPTDQTQGDTRTIVGTYGYMAPEYIIHGRFSVKSDVFSYGVLVLEIVSGKKIGSFLHGENEEDLVTYAWRNWREETIENIIDPTLRTSSRIETMRCIHIALLCVQANVAERPTVASVVSMLNSHSVTLALPTPAFRMQTNFEPDLSAMTESVEAKSRSGYVTENVPSNITEPYPR